MPSIVNTMVGFSGVEVVFVVLQQKGGDDRNITRPKMCERIRSIQTLKTLIKGGRSPEKL